MQSLSELAEEVYAPPLPTRPVADVTVHVMQPYQEFAPEITKLYDGRKDFFILRLNTSCSVLISSERLVELRNVINQGIEKYVCPLHGEAA